MKKILETVLYDCPKNYIQARDLAILLPGSLDTRYSLVKRFLKEKKLVSLKKGLYLIGKPYKTTIPNLFEIAQLMVGPSYISLESALSYHGWIPEIVYTITSVSPKRNNFFETSLGQFSFSTIPSENFYLGVQGVENDNAIFLMASPWRALADYAYVYRRSWESLEEIYSDLRIDQEDLRSFDNTEVKILAERYPNKRVRMFLTKLLLEL